MTVQIDWRNPLTRGLFRANIPSGPYSVNLVSSRISAPAAGTYSTGVSRVGKVQYGSESGGNLTGMTVYATDNIFKTYVDDTFTVAGLIYLPDNYASPAMVMGEGNTNQGSCAIIRTGNFTHVWNARAITGVTGPVVTTTDNAVDAVAGGSYLVVLSMNRNATDKLVLDVYRLDTGAQERVTSTDDVTNDFTGYDSFAFGWADDVGAALHLTWNRELTKAERDSLAENPWQLFKAQPIIGAHQLPTHVDYGMVKMPCTRRPEGNPLVTLRKEWREHLYGALDIYGGGALFRWTEAWPTTPTDYNHNNVAVDATAGTVDGATLKDGSPALNLDGTNVVRIAPDSISTITANEDYSMLWIGEPYWDGTDREGLFANGTFSPAVIMGSSGGDGWGIYDTAHHVNTAVDPSTIGKLTSVVLCRRGGASPNIELWVDGEKLIDVAGVSASLGGSDIYIGATQVASQQGNSKCGFFAFYKGVALPESQIAELKKNPWQIFKTKEIMVPINEDLPELGRFEIQS